MAAEAGGDIVSLALQPRRNFRVGRAWRLAMARFYVSAGTVRHFSMVLSLNKQPKETSR